MSTTKTKQRPRAGFPVHLTVTIEHADGHLDVGKKIFLPCPPFPGLFIESGAEAELDTQIDTIFYLEDEKTFRIICHPLSRPTWSHADAMENANREGWTVSE